MILEKKSRILNKDSGVKGFVIIRRTQSKLKIQKSPGITRGFRENCNDKVSVIESLTVKKKFFESLQSPWKLAQKQRATIT